MPRRKPPLFLILQKRPALVWSLSAQMSQIVTHGVIDHWIAALFFHNYQYTIKYFLYLPYFWRLLTKFLWGIFTYLLFISSLLQLIVRNWVVLMEFAGHRVLLLFSNKIYIVVVIGSLVQKLANNFNLACCQYSTTNKNYFSNILAINHVW